MVKPWHPPTVVTGLSEQLARKLAALIVGLTLAWQALKRWPVD